MTIPNKSAVEEILKGLEEEGQKQAEQILAEAQRQADEIIAAAKEKAEQEYEQTYHKLTLTLAAEVNRIIKAAETEREKLLAEAKLKFLDTIFARTEKKIKEMRNSDRYRKGLENLLLASLKEIGGTLSSGSLSPEIIAEAIIESPAGEMLGKSEALAIARRLVDEYKKTGDEQLLSFLVSLGAKRKRKPVVLCNEKDRETIEEIAQRHGIEAVIEVSPEVRSGVIVMSPDRKITVNNTISSRLEKVRRLLSRELIERFFG